MKVWKKNLIAAAILVTVCAGIYVNWRYTEDQAAANLTDTLDTEKVMSDDNLVLSEDMAAISAGEDVATTSTDYFAAVREEYKRRRDTVVNKLHEIPGVVCECPRGAFYIMAALPVDDADAFQKWLLEEFEDNGDTVMFAPGEPFYGTPGKGKNEIRIAYVLKQADLERAMDLLAKGIAAYNAR